MSTHYDYLPNTKILFFVSVLGIEEEGENLGSIEQLQEDDMNETIMMSQHVFDDIEGVGQNEEDAINIEDNDNNENIGANE